MWLAGCGPDEALHVHPRQIEKLKDALGCFAGGYKKRSLDCRSGWGPPESWNVLGRWDASDRQVLLAPSCSDLVWLLLREEILNLETHRHLPRIDVWIYPLGGAEFFYRCA